MIRMKVEQELRVISVAMAETTLLYRYVSVVLEVAILFILILIYLQLRRMSRRNKVAVPQLTVTVDKPSGHYLHGDTVKISGILKEDDEGVAGETVGLSVKYSDDTNVDLPDVTTDPDGAFTAEWVILSDVPPGSVILNGSALGIVATATFTLKKSCRYSAR